MINRIRPGQPSDGVKVEVALRQLRAFGASDALMSRGEKTVLLGRQERLDLYLGRLLLGLSLYIDCPVEQLRCDHDPALRTRPYNPRVKNVAARYTPHANDANALEWRPQGAEFARSHHVKTNVRGDNGQYSDVVLIKRERRREKKANAKKPRSRRHPNIIPRRQLRSANRWPPKGARKIARRARRG